MLIALEGIDGSGKGELAAYLREYFSSIGKSCRIMREPGGTPIGEHIRNILLDSSITREPEVECMLMLAARKQHIVDKLIPALQNNDLIIMDRFRDSTYAYQGSGRGLSFRWIEQAETMLGIDLTPDLVIMLDLDLASARERMHRRSTAHSNLGHDQQKSDIFETQSLDFFERVRQGYLALANQNPHRYRVLRTHHRSEAQNQSVAWIMDRMKELS